MADIPIGSDFSIHWANVVSSVGDTIDLDTVDDLTVVIAETSESNRVLRFARSADPGRFTVNAEEQTAACRVYDEDYSFSTTSRYFVQLWVTIGDDEFATSVERFGFASSIDPGA